MQQLHLNGVRPVGAILVHPLLHHGDGGGKPAAAAGIRGNAQLAVGCQIIDPGIVLQIGQGQQEGLGGIGRTAADQRLAHDQIETGCHLNGVGALKLHDTVLVRGPGKEGCRNGSLAVRPKQALQGGSHFLPVHLPVLAGPGGQLGVKSLQGGEIACRREPHGVGHVVNLVKGDFQALHSRLLVLIGQREGDWFGGVHSGIGPGGGDQQGEAQCRRQEATDPTFHRHHRNYRLSWKFLKVLEVFWVLLPSGRRPAATPAGAAGWERPPGGR